MDGTQEVRTTNSTSLRGLREKVDDASPREQERVKNSLAPQGSHTFLKQHRIAFSGKSE